MRAQVIMVGLAGVPVLACNDDETACPDGYICTPAGGSSGAAGNGGSGGEAGSGGAGGGTPAGCIPSENDEPVADECGVFVDADATDGGDGSKSAPFNRIGDGVAAASGGAVYVCAGTYSENVTLPPGTSLFGGLDCASWAYTGDRPTLTAPANTIPLVLSAGTEPARIEDFAVVAVDATLPGGSSIAVLADQATAALTRCDISAGEGADGAAGETPVGGDLTGATGGTGTNGCTGAMGTIGGRGVQKMCQGFIVNGGGGGQGQNDVVGGNGSPGSGPDGAGTGGPGGVGEGIAGT